MCPLLWVHYNEIDIEVQGDSAGAHIRRARYHSSMVDSKMLDEGQEFRQLKDSYIIFIYKHDKFRKGLPVYHIDRYIRETEELFDDGSHIIYVNGNYKGNDEIGQLMNDFRQTDSDKIHYAALAKGVKHFKDTEKGREQMCEAVEKYAKEYAVKEKMISVKNLMENMKLTVDQALNALGIQGDERKTIINQLQNRN